MVPSLPLSMHPLWTKHKDGIIWQGGLDRVEKDIQGERDNITHFGEELSTLGSR